jgi:mono/diheme cytochrome c family protein
MPNLPCYLLAGIVLVAVAVPLPGTAQQHGDTPGMNMQETQSAAPYHPGLGDLMTAFVQPRHIKLGLAGNEQNWPYAAFELGELTEAFDDIAELVPQHDNLRIPEMIGSTVKQPMEALEAAIKAKDIAAYTKAYADLTASCNACHQSAGHPEIVIQVPTVSFFPDQDFRPQK